MKKWGSKVSLDCLFNVWTLDNLYERYVSWYFLMVLMEVKPKKNVQMCITVVDGFESMFWRRRYEYTVDSTVPVVLSGIYSPAALCIQNRTQFIVLLCIALHPKNMQYTLLYILYSTRGGRNHFPIRQFLYTVPKINLNLRVKTEPVTAGVDATVNVWFQGQLQYNKAGHIPLHPLQPWKTPFLSVDSTCFWDSLSLFQQNRVSNFLRFLPPNLFSLNLHNWAPEWHAI